MRTRRLGIEQLEDRLTPNNRFVVPLNVTADNVTNFHTLASALTTPGLAAGDAVEIQPASTPGTLSNAAVAAIPASNVTIRGSAGYTPAELPLIQTADAITVAAAWLTFQNVNLQINDTLRFIADGAIRNSAVTVGATVGNGLVFDTTYAAALQGNTITNIGVVSGRSVVAFRPMPGSRNLVDGNTFRNDNVSSSTLLAYTYGQDNQIFDVVSNNTFIGDDAVEASGSASYLLSVLGGAYMTVRNNTFRDATAETPAVFLQHPLAVQFTDNVFALTYPSAAPSGAALTISGSSTNLTTVFVQGNTFATGDTGRAVDLLVGNAGIFNVIMRANTFEGNKVGVHVVSTTNGFLGNIVLGDGNNTWSDWNNFRGFRTPATATSGAIVVNTGTINTSGRTISALNNLFGVADPETVIWDKADDGTRADVTATGNVTGNAAFVQALYTRYLKRVGYLSSTQDAGYWVNQMANGMSQAAVAYSIMRSPEAVAHVVDDLYRTVLGRTADQAGREHHINAVGFGWTVEQVQAGLYSSAEYATRFGTDRAYVTSLFTGVLGRVPSEADVNAWVALLPSLGRGGVAMGFLNSTEYRNLVVREMFFDMLKRTNATAPSNSDVAAWVNTGLDVLSLRVAFAGTAEFYLYG